MSARRPKLCVGASSGGHMNELLSLLRHSEEWPLQPSVFVSTIDIAGACPESIPRRYVLGECDRRHPLRAIRVTLRAFWCILRERPDAIVTTGSLPLAILSAFGKLLGARIVWIDSIANSSRPSRSGSFVAHFADLFLVQWPHVAAEHPRAEYAGEAV